MDHAEPQSQGRQIGFLLNDTARLFRREFDAQCRCSGITVLQWRLLASLRRNEGIAQGPLAELIEVEPITLSRMIGRLGAMGLVERRHDPADRRVRRLYLTGKGSASLDAIAPVSLAVGAAATQGIAEADLAALIAVLQRMQGNLSRRECEGRKPVDGG